MSDLTVKPDRKRLLVTLVYEYEVDPSWYPNGNDPFEMARIDIDQDISTILSADWQIHRAVFIDRKS